MKCVNIPNIINYMCSELLQSYQLNSRYINLQFLHFYIFYIGFSFRINQYFLSFRYIFHLLIDYLSIYQNTTQSRAKKDIRRNFTEMQSLRIIQDLFLLWLVLVIAMFGFFSGTQATKFQLLRHTFTVTLTYWHTKNKAIIRRKLLVFEMQKLQSNWHFY